VIQMEIIKADHFATCFGVERALNLANQHLHDQSSPVYSYGQLIHNNDVLKRLSQQGLKIIRNLEELASIKKGKLIIRSHGAPKAVYDYCAINHIELIDATCPKVKRIHKIVETCCEQSHNVIVFGDKMHPEVIGIMGWCVDKAIVCQDLEEYKQVEDHLYKKQCIVFQTTFNINQSQLIKEYFHNGNNSDIIVKDTICNATDLRQQAARKLAVQCDSVLVIGGKQSSNTKKLYEISKEFCENSFWIENSNEIPYNLINKTKKLGITAGASTPSQIVEEVIFNVREKRNA